MRNDTTTPDVLLLHGIWNADAWLRPFAKRLRAAGFSPAIAGYASVLGDPDRTLDRLAARVAAVGHEVALVGHSLGGVLALELLRRHPELPVTRVVCLGSPLRGSAAAGGVAARAWCRPVLGRSAALLQRDLERWDGTAAVGMVAGVRPRGLGQLFCRFDGPSDGTVAIAETELPGLADHCRVDASHSGLVFSPDAVAQTACFLRHGHFRVADDADAGPRSGAAGLG